MPYFVDFAPKCTFGRNWAPKPSIFLELWKDFRPGPEKCAFFCKNRKFHEISWNFMKFREISGKARRRGARKWKGWFGTRQVAISGGDFYLENWRFPWFSWKVEFSWISWNFIIFTKPHFLPQSALWAIWAPKTINICCAMEGFPPRAGNVRFFAKSCIFAFFIFSRNHFFHDFHDFHGKTRIFELCKISRKAKVRKSAFSWFSWIFHENQKKSGNFQNFQIFGQNDQENRGCWFCFVFFQWKINEI